MASFFSIIYAALLLALLQHSTAFAPLFSKHAVVSSKTTLHAATTPNDRRAFMNQIVLPAAASGILSNLFIPSLAAQATIMDNSIPQVKTFKAGENLGVEEAKKRFQLAIQDVDELLDNYAEISTNGDNVRRYLGTVG